MVSYLVPPGPCPAVHSAECNRHLPLDAANQDQSDRITRLQEMAATDNGESVGMGTSLSCGPAGAWFAKAIGQPTFRSFVARDHA
jgi:hypothetical protein